MTIVDDQYIRRNPVGPLGRRVIAHAQAAADKRRGRPAGAHQDRHGPAPRGNSSNRSQAPAERQTMSNVISLPGARRPEPAPETDPLRAGIKQLISELEREIACDPGANDISRGPVKPETHALSVVATRLRCLLQRGG